MIAPQRPDDDTPVGIIKPIAMGEMASADDLVDFDRRRRLLRRRRGAVTRLDPSTPSSYWAAPITTMASTDRAWSLRPVEYTWTTLTV